MTYQPRRTARFGYAGDVIVYVEDRQCGTCAHKERGRDMEQYPMCASRAALTLCVEPVTDWDEPEPDHVVCRAYEPEQIPGQTRIETTA